MNIRKGSGSQVQLNTKEGMSVKEMDLLCFSLPLEIRFEKGTVPSALYNATGKLSTEETTAVLFALREIRAY